MYKTKLIYSVYCIYQSISQHPPINHKRKITVRAKSESNIVIMQNTSLCFNHSMFIKDSKCPLLCSCMFPSCSKTAPPQQRPSSPRRASEAASCAARWSAILFAASAAALASASACLFSSSAWRCFSASASALARRSSSSCWRRSLKRWMTEAAVLRSSSCLLMYWALVASSPVLVKPVLWNLLAFYLCEIRACGKSLPRETRTWP